MRVAALANVPTGTELRRPPLPAGAPSVGSKDIEQIRRVFDEDAAGKKLSSIISPREDAQMFRSCDRLSVSCECIVELYELLWRWGHRNTEHTSFEKNFGFAIPDTIVFHKGKPYAWFFISKKDGALLKKKADHLNVSAIEKKICHEFGEVPICATWLPMASQFPEARCHSQVAEFLSVNACRSFLANMRSSHSGIIQVFVEPQGVSNYLIRTVQFKGQTSLCVRTNRSLLVGGRGHVFDRAATYEGWEGLSSSCSRYRSHRHPHMEERILAAGQTLNERIEQEQVRKMLFLELTQHVALHFKVDKDNILYFIHASVVSEKDVILQTRPQLLMGDSAVTEELPGGALLRGGTTQKAVPHEPPAMFKRLQEKQEAQEATAGYSYDAWGGGSLDLGSSGGTGYPASVREGSLPPLQSARGEASPRGARRRVLSARKPVDSILPIMGYARPAVPEVPYKSARLEHSLQEAGRYEYMPPFMGEEVVKRPLIIPNSARSEGPHSSRSRVMAYAHADPDLRLAEEIRETLAADSTRPLGGSRSGSGGALSGAARPKPTGEVSSDYGSGSVSFDEGMR